MINLTDEQQHAANAITNLTDNAYGRLCLSGAAGTGKTTTVAKALSDAGVKALFVATTNFAATVIQAALWKEGREDVCITVSRAIGQYLKVDKDTGRKSTGYKKATNKSLSIFWDNVDIVIVDEASMLTREWYWNLEKLAKHYRIPIVYTGDQYQLGPVDEKSKRWSVFNEGFDTVELLTPMRQNKDSSIYSLANTYRDKIKNNDSTRLPIKGDEDVLVIPDKQEWLELLKEMCGSGKDALALSTKNETVRHLHNVIVGVEDDENAKFKLPREGEKIILQSNLADLKNGDEIIIKSTEGVCIRITDVDMKEIYASKPSDSVLHCYNKDKKQLVIHGLNFTGLKIDGADDKAKPTEVSVYENILVDDVTAQGVKTLIRKLRKELDIINGYVQPSDEARSRKQRFLSILHQLDGLVLKFGYGTSSTIHKSQGRSVDYVFIATDFVMDHKKQAFLDRIEWLRLIYVGITRAKKKVIFYANQQLKIEASPEWEATVKQLKGNRNV